MMATYCSGLTRVAARSAFARSFTHSSRNVSVAAVKRGRKAAVKEAPAPSDVEPVGGDPAPVFQPAPDPTSEKLPKIQLDVSPAIPQSGARTAALEPDELQQQLAELEAYEAERASDSTSGRRQRRRAKTSDAAPPQSLDAEAPAVKSPRTKTKTSRTSSVAVVPDAPDDPLMEEASKVDASGTVYLDRAHLGGGVMQWYHLKVIPNKDKKFVESMQMYLAKLTVEDPESGEEKPFTADFWVPTKKVKSLNEKTGKMGYKTKKFNEGQSVFMQCVLTDEAVQSIQVNYLFKEWADVRALRVPREQDAVLLPVPATAEFMESLEFWQQLNEDEDQAERVAEVFGVAGGEILGKDDRRSEADLMAEQLGVADVDNPSNWYSPEASTDKPAATSASGRKKSEAAAAPPPPSASDTPPEFEAPPQATTSATMASAPATPSKTFGSGTAGGSSSGSRGGAPSRGAPQPASSPDTSSEDVARGRSSFADGGRQPPSDPGTKQQTRGAPSSSMPPSPRSPPPAAAASSSSPSAPRAPFVPSAGRSAAPAAGGTAAAAAAPPAGKKVPYGPPPPPAPKEAAAYGFGPRDALGDDFDLGMDALSDDFGMLDDDRFFDDFDFDDELGAEGFDEFGVGGTGRGPSAAGARGKGVPLDRKGGGSAGIADIGQKGKAFEYDEFASDFAEDGGYLDGGDALGGGARKGAGSFDDFPGGLDDYGVDDFEDWGDDMMGEPTDFGAFVPASSTGASKASSGKVFGSGWAPKPPVQQRSAGGGASSAGGGEGGDWGQGRGEGDRGARWQGGSGRPAAGAGAATKSWTPSRVAPKAAAGGSSSSGGYGKAASGGAAAFDDFGDWDDTMDSRAGTPAGGGYLKGRGKASDDMFDDFDDSAFDMDLSYEPQMGGGRDGGGNRGGGGGGDYGSSYKPSYGKSADRGTQYSQRDGGGGGGYSSSQQGGYAQRRDSASPSTGGSGRFSQQGGGYRSSSGSGAGASSSFGDQPERGQRSYGGGRGSSDAYTQRSGQQQGSAGAGRSPAGRTPAPRTAPRYATPAPAKSANTANTPPAKP